MSVVKSSLEVALRKDSPNQLKKAVMSSIDEIDGLINFSSNLLLLSRLKDGITGGKERFNLSIMALETVENVLHLHPASRIEVDIPQEIELIGIQSLIARALYNLLDNACKYGTGDIFLKIIPETCKKLVEVWNWGEPLGGNDLETMYQKFSRGRNADGTDGSGLGLTIARYVAVIHGGNLTYRHEKGFNIFCITLNDIR